MPARFANRFAPGSWSALLLAAVATGCSQEYLVLESAGGTASGGNLVGGFGGSTGGVSFGGADGGYAVGGAQGGIPVTGGTQATGGTASAGSNSGGMSGAPIGSSCATHDDCETFALCIGFQCVACSAAPNQCERTCAHGFALVSMTRNGCSLCECAPPSHCTVDADCSGAESCYAGSHCQEGCNEPSCCFGNHCGPSGCGEVPAACQAFGCGEGQECLAACDATDCACDGTAWSCVSSTGGAPVASCPQVCAPP